MRKYLKKCSPAQVEVKKKTFQFPHSEDSDVMIEKEAPMVKIKDIVAFTIGILTSYEQKGFLTWRNGKMSGLSLAPTMAVTALK